MTMKDETIVHYTHQTLPKGKTDWKKLKSLTSQNIQEAASSDPDNPIWTAEMFEASRLMMPQKKVSVHMYLDQEIVDWFKSEGKGYQSRINAVLKSYVHKNHA